MTVGSLRGALTSSPRVDYERGAAVSAADLISMFSLGQSSVRLDRAAENAGRVVRDNHAAAYLTNSSYLAR